FINEFNNTYNLKNKKLVFKAHASDSGFSGLNLDAKAHGVRIVCMTHNFTMGIMFYDKIDNMKLYSAKRYSIYKLPEFRNGEQLIAVFYLRCPDRLINESLKKNSLSKIFTCIQIRQNKEIYYLLKPFLKHIEY
ncbi:MAG: hypothetical protein GY756_06650, partial [bacterium]|nr:hypothetical protein [bacterium]